MKEQREMEPWGGLENFEEEGTPYPVFDRPGAVGHVYRP